MSLKRYALSMEDIWPLELLGALRIMGEMTPSREVSVEHNRSQCSKISPCVINNTYLVTTGFLYFIFKPGYDSSPVSGK